MLLKRNIHFFLLNVVLIACYIIVYNSLLIDISDQTMFSTHDAKSYLNVAFWIEGDSFGHSTLVRPFLFPLLLMVVYNLGGTIGIWVLHFLFWIVSINLVFRAINNITKSVVLSYFFALLVALNITYIVLTLHALTEVTTTFLLSILIYYVFTNYGRIREIKFFYTCLVIIACLTVVKPIFIGVLLGLLLIVLPSIYSKQLIRQPVKIGLLLIILTPIFTQIGIMKTKHNYWGISKVGSIALDNCLMAQGVRQLENINDRRLSIRKAKIIDNKATFMLDNFVVYTKIYLTNIKKNINAVPVFLSWPKGVKHKKLSWYMEKMNSFYLLLHLFFVLPLIWTLIKTYKNKNFDVFLMLLGISLLMYYYLLASGISSTQGDRLSIPMLAVWPVLYAYIIHSSLNAYKLFGRTS